MKIKRWLLAILLLTIIFFGLAFIKFGQIQAAIAFAESFPEPSASVMSEYAKTQDYAQTTKVIGQIEATQSLVISNEYAGVITHVGFNPGDVVEKDQLLLKIDTSVEQANLSAAKAKVKLAQKTHQRLLSLVKQNRTSQDQVDRAEADLAIAKSEVANLTTIITKKEIRAPFAGRVDLTQYQVGQLLDANSQITALVGIADNIWVNFSIPQTLAQPRIGENVTLAIATDDLGVINKEATVIAKQSSLDAHSRQQSYRAKVGNKDGALVHNQIVNVIVPNDRKQVVMVPTNAITRNHFGSFVYQLVKDEKGDWRAKPLQVTLGDKVNNEQVVLSGLTGNEFIATEGAFKLSEGLLVYTQTGTASLGSSMAASASGSASGSTGTVAGGY